MPGYIHTCDKCGAHMQVHERYLGRTLRCTSCRTEFEATLPEGAVIEDAPVPEPESGPPKPSAARFLPWVLLLLIPIIGLAWFLGQDQSDGPAESIFREQRSVGENATVDAGSGKPVLVALEYEAVAALLTLGQGNIQVNVGALMDQEKYIELPSSTNVRVIDYTDKGRVARIRILEGPWQSRIVWIPSRWIR